MLDQNKNREDKDDYDTETGSVSSWVADDETEYLSGNRLKQKDAHNNTIRITNKRHTIKQRTTKLLSLDNTKQSLQYGTTTGGISFSKVMDFKENVFCVRITPDLRFYAVGLQNGNISFYSADESIDGETHINDLRSVQEHSPATDMEFISFDGNAHNESKHFLLVSYASGFIRMWHYNSPNLRNRLIREWQEQFYHKTPTEDQEVRNNQILSISVSGDRQRFVTGGEDHVIKVYEITSKTVLRLLWKGEQHNLQTGRPQDAVLKADFHTLRITAILYHPLGKQNANYSHILISASWDNTIQIWDDRKTSSLWQYIGPHVCGADGIDIDPNSNTIVSCSWKREKSVLQIWKFNEFVLGSGTMEHRSTHNQFTVPTAEYYQDMAQIPSQGYVAQFVMDGQFIVFAGSNNNICKVVEAEGFNPVGAMFNLKNAIISACMFFDPIRRQNKLAMASAKSIIILNVDFRTMSARKSLN